MGCAPFPFLTLRLRTPLGSRREIKFVEPLEQILGYAFHTHTQFSDKIVFHCKLVE